MGRFFMASIRITTRRTIVFGLLTVMVLIGCLAFGVQEAFALSFGESARYTILVPFWESAVYQTYKTVGVVSTADGLAYAVTSKTEIYSYVDGNIGTQLLARQIGLALISVDHSKLLYSTLDFRWFDENGKTVKHHVTSVKFKHVGKTAIVDCVAHVLPTVIDLPLNVTAHFEISDADSISTERNELWYYMLYQRDYKIGKTYRIYQVFWNRANETWGYEYDDMKVIGKLEVTVDAGTFRCYHFERQNPLKDWSPCLQDEYVMVGSKAVVCAEGKEGTIEEGLTAELTGYRPGWN
jgi:hypothetical protein